MGSALESVMNKPDVFKEFRLTGTSGRDVRDTRSLYVVAKNDDEAFQLIQGHGYTDGYRDFKTDGQPKPAAEGPARVLGIRCDIATRP
jgi:hypothetical protein